MFFILKVSKQYNEQCTRNKR